MAFRSRWSTRGSRWRSGRWPVGARMRSQAMGGQVWQSTYSTQARRTVTETIDSQGAVTLHGFGPGVPWPDGRCYAAADWDGTDTTLLIIDPNARRVIQSMRFPGLLVNMKPAPGRSVIAARHCSLQGGMA